LFLEKKYHNLKADLKKRLEEGHKAHLETGVVMKE